MLDFTQTSHAIEVIIIISLLKVENRGSERLSQFLKVTQLGSDFCESPTQAFAPRAGCLTPMQNPPVKGQVLPLLSEGQEMRKGKIRGKAPGIEQREMTFSKG